MDHLQPFSPDSVATRMAPSEPQNAITPILHGERSLAMSLGALAFLPADTTSALLLALAAAVVLRRRGRPWRLAVVWVAAVAVGLAAEVAGKLVIPQMTIGPPSEVFGITIDGSYPSGHTTRSVIVAAMVAALWPRARLMAVAWVVYVTCVLELGGLHVPSDIAGGFLLGGALACAALAYDRDRTRTLDPRPVVQSGGRAPAKAPRPADLQAPPGAADGGGR
jgi:membrane-associated phospholipid phosphatase